MSAQREAWQGLLEQPLNFVRPPIVRECLPEGVSDHQVAALRNTPRFEGRLLQLLAARFKLPALGQVQAPQEEDLPVLLLAPKTFQTLPRLCGAIWHSATLSREIRSDAVTQLRSALGNEVFATALAHRALAGAADLLRQPADLLQAIDRDGAACVAGWLAQLPADLRIWLRLRLDLPPFDGQPVAAGAEIVRRAAATLDQPAGEVA
jgi:hypothetical protein